MQTPLSPALSHKWEREQASTTCTLRTPRPRLSLFPLPLVGEGWGEGRVMAQSSCKRTSVRTKASRPSGASTASRVCSAARWQWCTSQWWSVVAKCTQQARSSQLRLRCWGAMRTSMERGRRLVLRSERKGPQPWVSACTARWAHQRMWRWWPSWATLCMAAPKLAPACTRVATLTTIWPNWWAWTILMIGHEANLMRTGPVQRGSLCRIAAGE
jgi:hypothetical protein